VGDNQIYEQLGTKKLERRGGNVTLIRCIAIALTFHAIDVRAADSVRTLDGFGEYKFGMTYEAVLKSRNDHNAKACNALKCIERETTILGIPVSVRAVFRAGENTLKLVTVMAKDFGGTWPPCPKAVPTLNGALSEKYGAPDSLDDAEFGTRTAQWNFTNGATIKSVAGCATDTKGLVVIAYEQQEAL
jgi:hypothetical protein